MRFELFLYLTKEEGERMNFNTIKEMSAVQGFELESVLYLAGLKEYRINFKRKEDNLCL